jgi:AraC-like DNA-binding protein
MHHRLFGWLIGQPLELLAVEVCYAPLLSQETTALLMPYPIRYAAPENLFRFPARFLDQPVVRSYAELVRLLEHFPFDLEETHSLSAPLSERISTILGTRLAQRTALPTIGQLARQFSISPATLKRHLAQEATSMLSLKNLARQDVARRLLSDPALAVGEVAIRVGFYDQTTFSRAFKQWMGRSPARWRRLTGPSAKSAPPRA